MKRNKFNGIALSKEFIEKYKSFQTNFLMRILKNLINDRSYKIYKFHKNDKVLAENFIKVYSHCTKSTILGGGGNDTAYCFP